MDHQFFNSDYLEFIRYMEEKFSTTKEQSYNMAVQQNSGTSSASDKVSVTPAIPISSDFFEEDPNPEVVATDTATTGEDGEVIVAESSVKEKWRKGYRDFMSEISAGL